MTSSITYSLVILTTDGATSFLQLLDVQNVRKNTRFCPNKSYRKLKHSVQNRVGVIKIVIVINCYLITFSEVIACICN